MFSPIVWDLFNRPHHQGSLAGADAIGREGLPGDGPYMAMYLRLSGERIAEAWFETYGCPAAVACGSFLTRWVAGRTAREARVLEAEDLSRVLGGLPLGKEHCAYLAVSSLRDALRQLDGAAAP